MTKRKANREGREADSSNGGSLPQPAGAASENLVFRRSGRPGKRIGDYVQPKEFKIYYRRRPVFQPVERQRRILLEQHHG